MDQLQRFYDRYEDYPEVDISRIHKPELAEGCAWYNIALAQIKNVNVPDVSLDGFRELGCYQCEGRDRTCGKYLERSRK